jgi:predicted tellurium resistance membrane protein TerC
MDWMSDPNAWVGFLTLAGLEIVLGIDNIVFISILVGKLEKARQPQAYRVGLGLALISRILLLMSLSWVMGLTRPLFEALGREITGRDLVLILGGLFLIAKSTLEIHERLEGEEGARSARVAASYTSVLIQIMLLDLVFSLDSVITAVGMVTQVTIMIAAVILAVVVMMVFARRIGDFVHRHPSVKMLALAFLLLIGVVLMADGLGHHVPKGYIYSAMAFSLFVELLNLRARARSGKAAHPVDLREPYVGGSGTGGSGAPHSKA